MSQHQLSLAALHLRFIGSEFANLDPGNLEGAIDAVDRNTFQRGI